jgi:hypothetical protein
MQNNNFYKKNRVYAPIIIGISLLFISLVSYPLYIQYMDINSEIATLEKSKIDRQKKIDEISAMQLLFTGSWFSDIKSKVQKYNRSFDVSNIVEAVMVNKFTKASALSPSQINIGGISVEKWKKLPSWLSLATVSITVWADTPDQVIDYLTYLTTESSFAFTIDRISLPLDTWLAAQDKTWLSLSLNLWVYYYE